MSWFSGLNTAVSGLYAAQRAMEVTGQNVVNANTPGYSRQRVTLAAVGSPVAPALSTATTGGAPSDAGVTVTGVTRVKDAFVEGARAAAGARQAALGAQTGALGSVETLLSEPGDNGLSAGLDAFYSAWHDLANKADPTDVAAGSVVVQRGLAVTDQLHALADGLAGQWAGAHDALADVVAQVDRAAADLADVNGKVAAGLVAGRPIDELLDRRDTLARTLGTLVGGQAAQNADGTVSVSVGGVALVAGATAQQFALAGATGLGGAAADPPRIVWGSTTVPVASGSAAGHLAVLTGDLPTLKSRVDAVATSLRDAVNSVHETGYRKDGSPGGPFFSGTDAATLTVAVTSPAELAAAATPGTLDGSVAMRIGDLADDATAAAALGADGPSARWRDLVTVTGVHVQSLKNASSAQDSVVAAADAAVQADSGVNIDEEMTNLLQYQRAYQASARLVTTVDEMLDTLVNHTGTVGR